MNGKETTMEWDGKERRNHVCYQEENIGKFNEFIEDTKGMRPTIIAIVVTIMVQVGAFLFMWGGLTNTVKKNSDYLWNTISISTRENTRNLDRLMAKLESLKIIAIAHEKDILGESDDN